MINHMPERRTKRANRHYKAKNRQENLAKRAATNSARASSPGKNPQWTGIRNPPAPHTPKSLGFLD